MNVLIIEDEPFAQQELIRMLEELNRGIDVVGCIDSVEAGIHYLTSQKTPDLIFMDIQLSDGISFEIFKRIEVKPPVIFTTAFDEYAVKAFKVNSIDYLLKPVDEEELVHAIKKFELLAKSEQPEKQAFMTKKQVEEVLGLYKPSYKSRLVVKLGEKIKHVEASNIAYFYSEDKVSFLITNQGERFIINYSLEQIEKMMNPADFYRLNRKFIAQINAIESIDKYFNSRLKIGLKPDIDDEVLISRTKVSDFLNWLER